MAGNNTARKNQGKAEDVLTWWEKLGLTRHRLLRNGRKSVMVWLDKNGKEYKG